jgi:hypothetical protein
VEYDEHRSHPGINRELQRCRALARMLKLPALKFPGDPPYCRVSLRPPGRRLKGLSRGTAREHADKEY